MFCLCQKPPLPPVGVNSLESWSHSRHKVVAAAGRLTRAFCIEISGTSIVSRHSSSHEARACEDVKAEHFDDCSDNNSGTLKPGWTCKKPY